MVISFLICQVETVVPLTTESGEQVRRVSDVPQSKASSLEVGRASGFLWSWQVSTWQASFSWNADPSYLCMDRAACPPALLAIFLGCPGWWVVGGGQWAEERPWSPKPGLNSSLGLLAVGLWVPCLTSWC